METYYYFYEIKKKIKKLKKKWEMLNIENVYKIKKK